jgi:hypothetical protein
MRSVVEVVECTKVDMLVTEKLCCAHQVLFIESTTASTQFCSSTIRPTKNRTCRTMDKVPTSHASYLLIATSQRERLLCYWIINRSQVGWISHLQPIINKISFSSQSRIEHQAFPACQHSIDFRNDKWIVLGIWQTNPVIMILQERVVSKTESIEEVINC